MTSAERPHPHPDLGRVGRDGGQLVLRLEKRVALPSMQVYDALTALRQDGSALRRDSLTSRDGCQRWEVDPERSGSRVIFTAWIDADDVEAAADVGAAHHVRFDRLLGAIEQDPSRVRHGTALPHLTDAYLSAFAAALADTD